MFPVLVRVFFQSPTYSIVLAINTFPALISTPTYKDHKLPSSSVTTSSTNFAPGSPRESVHYFPTSYWAAPNCIILITRCYCCYVKAPHPMLILATTDDIGLRSPQGDYNPVSCRSLPSVSCNYCGCCYFYSIRMYVGSYNVDWQHG